MFFREERCEPSLIWNGLTVRGFIFILSLCLAGSSLSAGEVVDQRPNVMLITADDMNWDSLGCFGNGLEGVSPNLDRLARQGLRFEHAYVTIAICQPCRASIMTARYPHRSGALGFDPINSGVPTLPETLRDAGYYTAAIGKAVHTIPSRHKTAFDQTYDMHELGYGRSPQRYRDTTFGAIRKAKEGGKPFFLNINLHDPHRPFANAPQEKRNKKAKQWEGVGLVANPYKPGEIEVPGFLPDLPAVRQEMAEYYTSVRRCDQIIGEVLQVLEESGHAKNTLVIFLSDHGISVPFAKTNCWMHSNRTPLIVRWPNHTIPEQTITDRMVSSIDLAPTILDAVGMPNLKGADGRSFRGLIDKRVQQTEPLGRDHVFVHLNYPYSRKSFAMRGLIALGQDKSWEGYIWNGWSNDESKFSNESMSGRTFAAMKKAAPDSKAIQQRVHHYLYRCPEELYDYDKDPNALNNLVGHRNVDSKTTRYRQILSKHLKTSHDPQTENYRLFLKQQSTDSSDSKSNNCEDELP